MFITREKYERDLRRAKKQGREEVLKEARISDDIRYNYQALSNRLNEVCKDIYNLKEMVINMADDAEVEPEKAQDAECVPVHFC